MTTKKDQKGHARAAGGKRSLYLGCGLKPDSRVFWASAQLGTYRKPVEPALAAFAQAQAAGEP